MERHNCGTKGDCSHFDEKSKQSVFYVKNDVSLVMRKSGDGVKLYTDTDKGSGVTFIPGDSVEMSVDGSSVVISSYADDILWEDID